MFVFIICVKLIVTIRKLSKEKLSPQDRLQVLHGDIQDHGEVVRVADLICLNNVFEFFMPPSVQARIWAFLRANIKKGALLVTIPSLEDSLQYIDVRHSNLFMAFGFPYFLPCNSHRHMLRTLHLSSEF